MNKIILVKLSLLLSLSAIASDLSFNEAQEAVFANCPAYVTQLMDKEIMEDQGYSYTIRAFHDGWISIMISHSDIIGGEQIIVNPNNGDCRIDSGLEMPSSF